MDPKVEAAADDAITKGKITPGRRTHSVTLITADPEMEKTLASIAPVMIWILIFLTLGRVFPRIASSESSQVRN
jgi:hypothetical protein